MAWRLESIYKDVPYLHNCDATLICKKKLRLVLYSAPSSIPTGNTYGVFYKHMKCSKVHAINGKVRAWNSDGIWDNHGQGIFWYISRWDIPESKVSVGMVHGPLAR